MKGFKLHRSKFTRKRAYQSRQKNTVSNSIGVNLHYKLAFDRENELCFKLHRSKFTPLGFRLPEKIGDVSNSIGVNLHGIVEHCQYTQIEKFQTPSE